MLSEAERAKGEHNGVLLTEAVRFLLAVCEATEAGGDEPLSEVWKEYSEKEKLAIAIAMTDSLDVGINFCKTFIATQLMRAHDPTHPPEMPTNREAARILYHRRKHKQAEARNN